MRTFGQILRAQITAKKLTLKDVAKSSGTHKGYVSGICNGIINPPSPKMVLRFCKALDLDFDTMLARASFEKLPRGLPYEALRVIIDEAMSADQKRAPGRVNGW